MTESQAPIAQHIVDPKTLPVASFTISIFHDGQVTFHPRGAETDIYALAQIAQTLITRRMQGHVDVSFQPKENTPS